VSVGDAFRRVSGAAWRAYDATFASLARRLGVYLVAGSIVLVEGDGRLRNVAHVYGPDGRLVARQPKLHLFPDEAGWGIAPGDDLQVFATPWCQMAVAVCMDMTYWEWARIATGRGAEVLVCPSANPAPYNAWEELRGTWGRVQESPAYGVFCSAFGDVAGLTIRGRSAVLAPLELSPSGDGVLAQAEAPDRPAVVVAELDLAALRRFRAECGPEPNRELLRRYLPAVYG
jgi:predicted amidohydrolase